MTGLSQSNASIEKAMITSINPATLEAVGEVEATHPDAIEKIVQGTRNAFPIWRDLGLDKRVEIIKKAQHLLLERSEEFAQLITLEMGRPYVESLVMEIEASIDLIGYYAKRAREFLDARPVPLHNIFFKRRKSYIHFQPLGVFGIIAPWNWPLLIPIGYIVPALLAGNAVVFKHSELTPLLSIKIHKLFLDAGVPEEILQIVQGYGSVGSALVNSSVEKIFFTGSTTVGQKVMQQAAGSLKKVVLELGGNDAAIVCHDADLEITSSGIVWGGFNNCGQNCNSVERVYVNENIAETFTDLVVAKIRKLQVGNGMEVDTDVGPLVSETQRERIETIVKNSVDKNARLLLGGNRINNLPGYFWEPTIILWDKSFPPWPDEEIFGPIIYITPVRDDEEAIRLANHSSFGLAASVWTSDAERGREIAHRLESGTVMINDVIVSFGIPEAGWTGIKNSGFGWIHGEKGMDEMVNIQYVNYDPQFHSQKFWWFHYTEKMIHSMKAGLSFLFAPQRKKRLGSVPQVLRDFTGYLLFNRKKNDKL